MNAEKPNNYIPIDEDLKEQLIVFYTKKLPNEDAKGPIILRRRRDILRILETLKENKALQKHIDEMLVSKQQKEERNRQAKIEENIERAITGKNVDTYDFPEERKNLWESNYKLLVSKDTLNDYESNIRKNKKILETKLNINHVLFFFKKMDIPLNKEEILESFSYNYKYYEINDPEKNALRRSQKYPLHDFVNNYIEEGHDRVQHIICGLKKISSTYETVEYNCILSVGSAFDGNSILFSDRKFKELFLQRTTILLVFDKENVVDSWVREDKKIKFFNEYLHEYFSIDKDTILKNEINPYITQYSFVYQHKNIEMFYLNTYYIEIYKSCIKPIIQTAKQSLFAEAPYADVAYLFKDTFIEQYFSYYFQCARASEKKSWNTNVSRLMNFLINLKQLDKASNKHYRDELFSAVMNIESKSAFIDIKTKSEADKNYSKIIQFAGQPNLWNLLEDEKPENKNGGTRKCFKNSVRSTFRKKMKSHMKR